MKKITVKLCTLDALLGTLPSEEALLKAFVQKKAPTPEKRAAEEAETEIPEEIPGITVFSRNNGEICLMAYQVKGFLKDACGALSRVTGTVSSTVSAYRKIIDGVIFVSPDYIKLRVPPDSDSLKLCTRTLRTSGPKGDRVALASSESLPVGTEAEFSILVLEDSYLPLIVELLHYGQLRGIGQWRNSGKGRFGVEFEVEDTSLWYLPLDASHQKKRAPKAAKTAAALEAVK